MNKNERHCVIVTGAGASRELGLSGPMPLMTDWAESLMRDLEAEIAGSAAVLGLREGIPGETFERNLGDFLALRASLDRVERFAKLGAPSAVDNHPSFADWHHRAVQRAGAIVEVIRTNLYNNFGLFKVDEGAARKSWAPYTEPVQCSRNFDLLQHRDYEL